jgi:formamidopyrimidine-DNA glycosylase
MPELPELEAISDVLRRRVVGQTVTDVEILPPGGPIVVRDLVHAGFRQAVSGRVISSVLRRGKFIVLTLDGGHPALFLAINLKLAGRLQLAATADKRHAKTHVILTLSGGDQVRFFDPKQMGQLYLTGDPAEVPGYAQQGPEPLELSLEEFRARLKPFRGEIKGILTRGECVAGIGNAYADEILWAARLHPYRKRTQLAPHEVERLYHAMQETLQNAVSTVSHQMGDRIDQEQREFMAIHMKTGQPCPRCGTPISMIGANQRITNFCRTCQPGGLIRGM